MSTSAPKSDYLQGLYWRSEILRLMYWLRGEGLGDTVDAPTLEKYLGVEAAFGLTYLDKLVEDGLLVREGEWYALSDVGLVEGEEEYLTAFSDLARPGHGECSPECWCQMSAAEAEVCTAQRQAAQPQAAQRQREIRDR